MSPTPVTWESRVAALRWVAYSPPLANPDKNIEASAQAIADDIVLLRRAGFTGLVTYGSTGMVGQHLPQLAEAAGFEGLILGVWDPANAGEMAQAEAAARLPIVLGFSVGNEGLNKRYDLATLSATIDRLRQSTDKPVATTEEIDDYADQSLLDLGDWVFPNAHPYFHGQTEPDAAATWTKAAYDDLDRRSSRLVLLKEVGLPTAGDSDGRLSEENQQKYYDILATTDVRFVYFEAFDQPWKTHLPIEPHWGIFRSDRTPKLLGARLLRTQTAKPSDASTFTVYRDAELDHHFTPSGKMGDAGDIEFTDTFESSAHSGRTSIRISYVPTGRGPNECDYPPPCRWAGTYWQHPPNNWGRDEIWKGQGYDLTRYTELVFWARADRPSAIEFKVGGIIGPYGDSLKYPRGVLAKLDTDWREFTIDLRSADLTHVIGGFAWVTNHETNPRGVTFYLDDIQFQT